MLDIHDAQRVSERRRDAGRRVGLQRFGIVTLGDGTSEGHAHNMANFRSAAMAGLGVLPRPEGSGTENAFVAMGYDAGEPGRMAPSMTPTPRTGPALRYLPHRTVWAWVAVPVCARCD